MLCKSLAESLQTRFHKAFRRSKGASGRAVTTILHLVGIALSLATVRKTWPCYATLQRLLGPVVARGVLSPPTSRTLAGRSAQDELDRDLQIFRELRPSRSSTSASFKTGIFSPEANSRMYGRLGLSHDDARPGDGKRHRCGWSPGTARLISSPWRSGCHLSSCLAS